MSAPSVGDLVLIEWVDSCSTGRWLDDEDFAVFVDTPYEIRSVGWLEHKDRRSLVIVADRASQGCGFGRARVMQIPRGCVQRVTVLRKQR